MYTTDSRIPCLGPQSFDSIEKILAEIRFQMGRGVRFLLMDLLSKGGKIEGEVAARH